MDKSNSSNKEFLHPWFPSSRSLVATDSVYVCERNGVPVDFHLTTGGASETKDLLRHSNMLPGAVSNVTYHGLPIDILPKMQWNVQRCRKGVIFPAACGRLPLSCYRQVHAVLHEALLNPLHEAHMKPLMWHIGKTLLNGDALDVSNATVLTMTQWVRVSSRPPRLNQGRSEHTKGF